MLEQHQEEDMEVDEHHVEEPRRFCDVMEDRKISFARLEEGARALLFYCLLLENARSMLQPFMREAIVIDTLEKEKEQSRIMASYISVLSKSSKKTNYAN